MNAKNKIPKNAMAVENFNVDTYLGTWYEIARFDFRVEKDLENVSAQYSLNKEGNIIVLNSGYNYKKEEWKKADGLAEEISYDIAKLIWVKQNKSDNPFLNEK